MKKLETEINPNNKS